MKEKKPKVIQDRSVLKPEINQLIKMRLKEDTLEPTVIFRFNL